MSYVEYKHPNGDTMEIFRQDQQYAEHGGRQILVRATPTYVLNGVAITSEEAHSWIENYFPIKHGPYQVSATHPNFPLEGETSE